MNKALITISTFPFVLVIGLATLLNYQSVSVNYDNKIDVQTSNDEVIKIDWRANLNKLKQFQQNKNEIVPVKASVQISIKDSTIVAIVADPPRSVLLFTEQHKDQAIQLNEGGSWLENWSIQQITPDTVIWQNSFDNQTYSQSLFSQPKVSDGTSENETNGK